MANKKTTTAKKTTTEKTTSTEQTKPRAPKQKKYAQDDLIQCKSIYAGTLLYTGDKTKITYEFSGIGDTRLVEYQDLLAGLVTKKRSLFAPYIIIEDEELLNNEHWKELKAIYDAMYDDNDLYAILAMPTYEFAEKFPSLPFGVRQTIATIAADLIRDGKFDSMNKIKIIDENCGTDLKLLTE